jgi:hypothetical protein
MSLFPCRCAEGVACDDGAVDEPSGDRPCSRIEGFGGRADTNARSGAADGRDDACIQTADSDTGTEPTRYHETPCAPAGTPVCSARGRFYTPAPGRQKGRMERVNRTRQDRLVKDLRLEGISTLEAANAICPGLARASTIALRWRRHGRTTCIVPPLEARRIRASTDPSAAPCAGFKVRATEVGLLPHSGPCRQARHQVSAGYSF